MTVPASLAGLPAIVLPAGRHEGLPLGVQLVAAQGRDDQLLEAATALEGALVQDAAQS